MSVSYNNIKRSQAMRSVIESALSFIDSTISFNQGDLLYLDTTAHRIKPITADANTANCLGVSRVQIVNGKLASPYSGTAVDSSQGLSDIPGPVYGVVAELTLNTGDAFNPGDLVYPIGSVDAQTVSSSSNTGARKACGIFVGVAVGSAVSGQKGLIQIGCQYQAGSINL